MRVPLRARGRSVGALTLLTYAESPSDYMREDVRFVEVLAGRVALALDNAGLSRVLRTTEAQLTTALGSLSEAVTIQGLTGELVYANDAAVQLLGFASPEEMLATPTAAILARFETFHADGRPLELADVPGRRVLAGEEPGSLEMRVIDRSTGTEQWRRTTASGVYDEAGALQLVVNVIADITAAKRAERSQRLLARGRRRVHGLTRSRADAAARGRPAGARGRGLVRHQPARRTRRPGLRRGRSRRSRQGVAREGDRLAAPGADRRAGRHRAGLSRGDRAARRRHQRRDARRRGARRAAPRDAAQPRDARRARRADGSPATRRWGC